jgi:dephospho-CoA kinase
MKATKYMFKRRSCLKIGLTGGICSGKSTATRFFQDLGIDIIDADVIARDLVKPGKPALNQVIEHFGGQLLDSNGELNRNQLREIIFNDPQEKEWLENLLHPKIHQEIERQLSAVHSCYCIIVIPLLLEKSWQNLVDLVLVIDTNIENQILRLMRRYKINKQEAKKILAHQLTRKQRLKYADDVIKNNSSLENLKQQVAGLHNKYVQDYKLNLGEQ